MRRALAVLVVLLLVGFIVSTISDSIREADEAIERLK